MHARLTAYLPDKPAHVRVLEAGEVVVGRGPDSGLRLEHPSVSRSHARMDLQAGRWQLLDLDSKNGSFIDGVRTPGPMALPPACWLRFGDVLCEFAELTEEQAVGWGAANQVRRAAATAHTVRLEGASDLEGLLDASLRGVVELAQCDRGFVLVGEHDHLQVRASLNLDPAHLGDKAFQGSAGAVRRALSSRTPVVCNDIGSELWLSGRQSVVAAGLHALVCVPLLDGAEIIGALYADRVHAGPPITALDLELLEAFSERAALWISVRRASDALRLLDPVAPEWHRIVGDATPARIAS